MNDSPLRVLVVEDNPTDAKLLLLALNQAGFTADAVRVQNEEDYLAQLESDPDIILCDYNLPQFDAMRALDLLKERHAEIPFLIVSGSIGEDTAVEAIKRGAHDYILKDRLGRLGSAVTHAFEERKLRESDRRTREALRASEEQYRALADSIPHIVWTARPDGALDYVNRRTLEYTGLKDGDITNWSWERIIHPEDLLRNSEAWMSVLKTGTPHDIESRIRRADGAYRWHMTRQVAIRDESGSIVRWIGTCTDVEDQKIAVERLARDSLLLASVRDSVVVTDLEGIVTYWNEGATRLFGWTASEMVGRPYADRFPEPTRSAIASEITKRAGGSEWNGEYEDYRKDGSRVWIDARVTRFADTSGQLVGILGVSHEITERKRAEQVIRKSEAFARAVLDSMTAHIAVLDRHGVIVAVNESWRTFVVGNPGPTGPAPRTSVGANYLEVCDASAVAGCDDARVTADGIRKLLAGEIDRLSLEYPCHSPDQPRWFLLSATPHDAGGCVVSHIEITNRKLVEQELQNQQRELGLILDTVPAVIFYKDLDHRFVRVNEELVRLVGRTRDAIEGYTDLELGSPHASQYYRNEREVITTGNPKRGFIEPLVTANGVRWLQTDRLPHRDVAGQIVGVIGFAIDITERKQAEDSFRQVQERLQHVIASSPAVLFSLHVEGDQIRGIAWISENVREVLGHSATEATVTGWWVANLHPEDRERVIAATERELIAKGRVSQEYRFRHQNGQFRWLRSEIRLVLNATGESVEAIGSWSDVTERQTLEAQYRQAQKMEAFGQLAAGVAHDFNNLLTVINGYSDLLIDEFSETDPWRTSITEVRNAGARAAALTAQLLSFSRKTIVEPKVLDLNELIDQVGKMLRRLIGEDITLITDLAASLNQVMADRGQMEQVLMNLVVNARDAMPKGGRLTIETQNVDAETRTPLSATDKPSRHSVKVTVSDTGTGMTAGVMAKIFEPFFTTKEVGKGTGLGLATVFGIVDQAGGRIEVSSEVGVGTTFTILLPAVFDSKTTLSSAGHTVRERGTETILLVEDEQPVRRFAKQTLESYGYEVLDAGNGAEALQLVGRYEQVIQLLVTDVVMPGMGGRELADSIRQQRPSVRVLYTSGYTDDAMIRYGVREEVDAFLPKPYTPLGLTQKVRAVLDAPRHPS